MATLPTGVEIRGNSICIWFIYRGKRCREILKGWANTAANIKKAGNLRSMIVSEINLGEFDYKHRFPESKNAKKLDSTIVIKTFGELADGWIKSREVELTANTLKKTASQLKTLKKIIGESTPIESITNNDILNYRSELLHGDTFYKESRRTNNVGRSVRTVDNYVSLLGSLLRFANRSRYITSKPYENVKKLQKSRVKPDPLLKQEFEQLKNALSGQMKNLWQFAIYSGIRHGELAALAWEDIDLEAGTVRICRNLNVLGMFGPPKTSAGNRTITLLKPAIEALKAQRELTALHPKVDVTFHHREYGKTETQKLHFVFMPRATLHGQKPCYSLTTIGAMWNKAVKLAGIRRRNPYHTRHTYACWLLSAGANPSFIASQMGHENAQMVYEIYGTWIEDMNNEQINMLNAKLAL
ncbi:site-specific integrase [Obesumbacterium proteus]|uniref:site-specific integrase n=1 Tax=Obesumbacterium proteus TaxID=82983 RepID=UPI001F3ADD46|nr:site-specific integrase [Obesumbacterium proteus]MCE9885162.1 site-specific integrase [Obesumbacterium proteus]MCE9914234.1 site-specific integrase [Obesumbacterium proteus]MCE9929332.1 site-specific integrase [Obesumbacterium proteus]MCG2878741.1 site-specific integrase [Obesumbacterium proteus]